MCLSVDNNKPARSVWYFFRVAPTFPPIGNVLPVFRAVRRVDVLPGYSPLLAFARHLRTSIFVAQRSPSCYLPRHNKALVLITLRSTAQLSRRNIPALVIPHIKLVRGLQDCVSQFLAIEDDFILGPFV